MTDYRRAYEEARDFPDRFWRRAAAEIAWDKPFERVLDDSSAPLYRWFPGGMLNTCYNAIDFHAENGRADQPAVIYDSPVTGVKRTLTFRELLLEVSRFAGVLTSLGVAKGDRVVIYMPMVPETLIAMYACARIGAGRVDHGLLGGHPTRSRGAPPRTLALRIAEGQSADDRGDLSRLHG